MPIIDRFFFVSSDLETLSIFPVDLFFFFYLLGKLSCYVPVFKENFTNEFTWTLYFSVKYKSKLMILALSSRLFNDQIIYSHSLFQLALFSSGPRDIYLSQAKTGRYRM